MWTEKCAKNEIGEMRVRRRDARIKFFALGVFAAVFLFTFLTQYFKKLDDGAVEAASLANFDPGYIISDYQMGNYNSMNEAEIQAFLMAKNSCSNTNYNTYLQLSANTKYKWHWKDGHFVCLSEELFGDGEIIGSGDTAAHIIWQAAQDYKINPQVLLVLLQKETGLITDKIPNDGDYRKATGYGCPDTAPCSSQYYGFKNQVRKAAALFRTVLDGGWTNYPLGANYVQYNPNPDCGGSVVNIRSLATSALYRYTPYQPNEGALAAGYGTAYCGAYGNRNFYLYFEDWFGSATAAVKSIKIPDGKYYIYNAEKKDMVIDVLAGAEVDGANVQLYKLNKTAAQHWEISYNSATDDYSIVNTKSGKALSMRDVDGGDIKDVQIWKSENTCDQRWKIVGDGNDSIKILSACSFTAVNIADAVYESGTNLDVRANVNTVAQQWGILPVDTISSGIYTIRAIGDKTKAVDISGGVYNAQDGTNIQIWANNNTGAQRWYISDTGGGYFTVTNLQSGKALDVTARSTENGANIHAWKANNTCAQRWKILKNKDESITFISTCSNKVLDVAAGSMKNGANIQLYTANNTKAQRWDLEKVEIVADDEYVIISGLSSKKALDVTGNQNRNGANIQIYDANGTGAQRWKITYDTKTDYYKIENAITGKVLDVEAAGTYGGVNVQTWNSNNTCAQKWGISGDKESGYIITSACSGLVLDVKDARTKNGTNVQMWNKNGLDAQKWVFNKL